MKASVAQALAAAMLGLLLAGCLQANPEPQRPTLSCAAACFEVVGEGHGRYWEPHIAVDPRDDDHVAAAVALLRRDPTSAGPESFQDDLLVLRSRDGGATWSETLIPHGPTAPSGHPLATSLALADPNVAFLPDGTLLVSGLAYSYVSGGVAAYAQGFRAWIARIPDSGEPDITVVAEDLGFASLGALGHRGLLANAPDAPTLVVAPDGTVHMSYRRMVQATPAEPESSVMMATRSTDGGRTWSPEVVVPTGRNAVASSLVATLQGSLLAAVGGWGTGGIGDSTGGYQMVARSGDGGQTWTLAELDDERLPSFGWWPAVGVSTAGVHAAYAADAGEGRERLLLVHSSEMAAAPAAGAMIPTLSGDGRSAVLTWFEPQTDGAVHFRARLLDGRGLSSAVTMDATLQDDAASLGEYFGVAVAGQKAWTVWTAVEPVPQLRVGQLVLS
jgi:hypothetical protein